MPAWIVGWSAGTRMVAPLGGAPSFLCARAGSTSESEDTSTRAKHMGFTSCRTSRRADRTGSTGRMDEDGRSAASEQDNSGSLRAVSRAARARSRRGAQPQAVERGAGAFDELVLLQRSMVVLG